MNSYKRKSVCVTLEIMLVDALILLAVDGMALFLRFDFSIADIPREYIRMCMRFFPVRVGITLLVFYLLRMYHYVWRIVSVRDVGEMIVSVLAAYLASSFVCMHFDFRMPRSYYLLSLFFQLFLFVGVRCFLRFYYMVKNDFFVARAQERIMIVGAGNAGQMLQKEIESSGRIPGRIVCFIDDDKRKWGKHLSGVKIVGGCDRIQSVAKAERITQIILAIPSASSDRKREILDICKMTGCRLRSLPGLYQVVNGEIKIDDVKDVQVEDLLGREPVELDLGSVRSFLEGKTVLVTGGGGSIGAELCRQIAKYAPHMLIILDIYENNAYDIQQELIRTYGPHLNLRVEIASVRDQAKIDELFSYYEPDIVFHAAAHKHVPLMESCPSEAVKNNIFGTYNVVCAAEKYGVSKFVMISTDKAVNPTNVMGATKRFCEMIIQSRYDSRTEFCCVRFGNVLGSNGSVIPLFKKQIAAGGPVTITDKRIIRYFMTIPEAVQLVLEAGEMASQGQIFVLDMGEPVKILTLAENLIRLSGLEPYKDIAISEIGLRPGEKLYEEMLMSSDTLSDTKNSKIFVEARQDIDRQTIAEHLSALSDALESGGSDELVSLLKKFVPTFSDSREVNQAAEKRLIS